ncbi:hypothetical protein [Streptomyces sp. RFCAC02]|uniref:hypothetical protein n=1 Tax=Streptomyces sp. RFCAC02 TaxID=2499143 RepID=UPI001F110420|nr:hypothetical protein [Streptomyces sp. RFCAC02]
MTAIGLIGGITTLQRADHLLRRLADRLPLPAGAYATTHVVRDPDPGVALALVCPGPVPGPLAGAAAEEGLRVVTEAPWLTAAERRTAGRAVVFPGWDGLTGSLTLAELYDRTAVARTDVLGGGVPDASAVLETRDHVRPQWDAGDLLLRLAPSRGGRFVPFEIPDPHPCCGGRH